jgi:hypothetical protein
MHPAQIQILAVQLGLSIYDTPMDTSPQRKQGLSNASRAAATSLLLQR